MAKIKSVGTISQFMNGEHKKTKRIDLKPIMKGTGAALLVPFIGAPAAFAAEPGHQCAAALAVSSQPAVQAGAMEWTADKMTEVFMNMLHPIVEILVGLSLPLAGVMILFKFFLLFFGKAEECWSGIAKVGMGYCLIQMFPLFQEILKQLGGAF